ncbi:MAG: SIS domain-containing protein [Solirubrobacteraceae bacterium]
MNNISIQHIAQKVFQDEINELAMISSKINDSFSNAIELILSSRGKIVLVGVGKSAHIAKKIEATLNSTGAKAQFMHATEAIHGDIGLLNKQDVVICFSKSGDTPEIKTIINVLKERSLGLIAITGNTQSFLALNADIVLDVTVEKEADTNNLAPTSSTTAQLVMGDALAIALSYKNKFNANDFAMSHPGGVLGKKLLWKVEDLFDKNQNKPMVNYNQSLSDVIISISSGKKGITAVFKENRLVGVVTDGDLRRMLQKQVDLHKITAEDIMSSHPLTIQKTNLALEALNLIKQNAVGQLIVLDGFDFFGVIDIHSIIKEGIS